MNQKLEYYNIGTYIMVVVAIVFILGVISFFLSKKTKFDSTKLLSYETGCLSTSDVSGNFDIHFYIIAIIFLIFDIEVLLMFPWVLGIKQLGVLGFYKILSLWTILTLGFVYEWSSDSLIWVK